MEIGASVGENPAAVVKKCKYTIAMLSDPSAALSVGFIFMLLSSLLPTVKAINIISLVPFFFSFLFKVVFDTDGVFEQIVSGKGYIDMSTVDVDTSSKISEVRAPFPFLSFFHGFIQLNILCFNI